MEELSTIMETRLLIEPPLTGLAAARRSAEELAQLLQLQQALENSFQTQQADYIARDTAFHLYLAQLGHNPLLRDIYSNIITWHTRLVEQAFLTFCDGDLDLYLHRTLCRYIREQREEEARALTGHMQRAVMCQRKARSPLYRSCDGAKATRRRRPHRRGGANARRRLFQHDDRRKRAARFALHTMRIKNIRMTDGAEPADRHMLRQQAGGEQLATVGAPEVEQEFACRSSIRHNNRAGFIRKRAEMRRRGSIHLVTAGAGRRADHRMQPFQVAAQRSQAFRRMPRHARRRAAPAGMRGGGDMAVRRIEEQRRAIRILRHQRQLLRRRDQTVHMLIIPAAYQPFARIRRGCQPELRAVRLLRKHGAPPIIADRCTEARMVFCHAGRIVATADAQIQTGHPAAAHPAQTGGKTMRQPVGKLLQQRKGVVEQVPPPMRRCLRRLRRLFF